MSRIGKRPVAIPSGVEAKIDNGTLSVKGPKGTLTMGLSDLVSYKLEDGKIAEQWSEIDLLGPRAATGACSARWCRTWSKA